MVSRTNLIELTQYTQSEEAAEEYLRKVGILKPFKECPYCKGERIGKIRRGLCKCYHCRKEWSRRRGSRFEKSRVPYQKVLLAIKLFELETSVRKASKQLGLAYNTTYSLYYLFRQIIVPLTRENKRFSGEIEVDESYFGGRRKGKRGRGAANKNPVFGILERGGKVRVDVVEDVKGDTLLNLTLKKVKRGSLIYTDKFRSYDGLVSYGFKHERIDHGLKFANGKVYINGIEGFWSFAKERLTKYHGIDPGKFPLYLKELEIRYKYQNDDLFDVVIRQLKA